VASGDLDDWLRCNGIDPIKGRASAIVDNTRRTRMRFHVISGEVTDQLTERVNAWLEEREKARPATFHIHQWSVTHDPNFIYWTVAYSE
jgi:hypothetical protein